MSDITWLNVSPQIDIQPTIECSSVLGWFKPTSQSEGIRSGAAAKTARSQLGHAVLPVPAGAPCGGPHLWAHRGHWCSAYCYMARWDFLSGIYYTAELSKYWLFLLICCQEEQHVYILYAYSLILTLKWFFFRLSSILFWWFVNPIFRLFKVSKIE